MNRPAHQHSDPQTTFYPTVNCRPGTILYVDANPEICRLHRQALERLGYAVRTANDGMEGWDLLRRQHFDLVITDNDTARMDGLRLARQIRSGRLPLSLIIATGEIYPLVNTDLDSLRFAAILHKPFTLVDLLAAVRRALRVPSTRRAIGSTKVPVVDGDHLEHAAALSGHWGINE